MKYGILRAICAVIATAWVALAAESTTAAYVPSPAQVAQWDAEFAALAASQTQPRQVYRVRVVDQLGRPIPNFPVWVTDANYKPNAASDVYAGGSGLDVSDGMIMTNAQGVASYPGGGSYSFMVGVLGRFVPVPWVVAKKSDYAFGDSFHGIHSSAGSEADIRAGLQIPRPNHTTVSVYAIPAPIPQLWRKLQKVTLQDGPPDGLAPMPVTCFRASGAWQRRPLPDQRSMRKDEWLTVERRSYAADDMPWAHLVLQGGVVPSATRPLAERVGSHRTTWWCSLTASGADLQVVDMTERFPLTAPATGYRSALRWEVPATVGQVTQWVWIRVAGTPVRYGCWELTISREPQYVHDYRHTKRSRIYPPTPEQLALPDFEERPAQITAEGACFLNPDGSRRLERYLNGSQEMIWGQAGLAFDPTVPIASGQIPARALFAAIPVDVTGVERLPAQTVVIPAPPAPAPAAAALTQAEIDELRAIPDNAGIERRMIEIRAQKAAAAASAARP